MGKPNFETSYLNGAYLKRMEPISRTMDSVKFHELQFVDVQRIPIVGEGGAPALLDLWDQHLTIVLAEGPQQPPRAFLLYHFQNRLHKWSPYARPHIEFRAEDGNLIGRVHLFRPEAGMPGNIEVDRVYDTTEVPFDWTWFGTIAKARFGFERSGWYNNGEGP